MTDAPPSWLPLAAAALGFVGSLMLAWPFFRTQRQRDDRDLLDRVPVADDFARQAVDGVRGDLTLGIDRAARVDFRIAGAGAVVLAASFLLSIVNWLLTP